MPKIPPSPPPPPPITMRPKPHLPGLGEDGPVLTFFNKLSSNPSAGSSGAVSTLPSGIPSSSRGSTTEKTASSEPKPSSLPPSNQKLNEKAPSTDGAVGKAGTPVAKGEEHGRHEYKTGILQPGNLPPEIESKIIGEGARYSLNEDGWLERKDILFVYRGDIRVGLDKKGMPSAYVGHDFDAVPNPIPGSTHPALAMIYAKAGRDKFGTGRLYMINTQGLRVAPFDDNVTLNAARIGIGPVNAHLTRYTEHTEMHISGPIEAWRITDVTDQFNELVASQRDEATIMERGGYAQVTIGPPFETSASMLEAVKNWKEKDQQRSIASSGNSHPSLVQARNLSPNQLKEWRGRLINDLQPQILPPSRRLIGGIQVNPGSVYASVQDNKLLMPTRVVVNLPARPPTNFELTNTEAFNAYSKEYIEKGTGDIKGVNLKSVESRDFIGVYANDGLLNLFLGKEALYDLMTLYGQSLYPADKTLRTRLNVNDFLNSLDQIRKNKTVTR